MTNYEYVTANITTTVPPDPNKVFNDEIKYLVVPLVVIVLIMLLSALVYMMAKKRRMTILRNNILRLYDFDSNEQEWESLNSYDNPMHINYNTTTF